MISESTRREVAVERVESPLGRWIVAHWSPPVSSQLDGLVERVWYFDGAMTHAKERVFPDGTAELVVMLDEPHRDGDSPVLAPFPAVCINGSRTRPSVVVAPHGRCRVLGVSFAPLGASVLLRSAMKDLLDVTIDLRDALGKASDELGERCAGAAQASAWNAERNAVAAVDAATRWTMQRLRGRQGDPLMQWASQSIREAHGVISIDELGAMLGLSRSQFGQRFRDLTGLGPKRFARIIRFRQALSLLGKAKNIASVATELGYYDQAHMHRDFEEFARMTPGEFLSRDRYPNSASLAES